MYTTLNQHYKARFGCKVYKLSLDAGFSCPNRDGTIDTRGCIFCSEAGSGDFAQRIEAGCTLTCIQTNLSEQLQKAKERVEKKIKDGKYIAYFQAFTNTYAPVETLEILYRQALAEDDIVGIAIGTRPDCLPEDVLDLLGELNKEKPVYVELGLQTVHKQTIDYIRRGYVNAVYFDAVKNLKKRGIHVVTHIILGLPGETPEMMEETTRQVIETGTDGVKFHLLHVLKNTDLERDYLAGKFTCLEMEEYGNILKKCLAIVPKEVVVHRITGDGAKKDLVAPLWSADKKKVLNYLNQILR